MSFPDPLLLKNAAAVAQTFTRRGPIPNGSRYVHIASTPALQNYVEARSLLVTPKKGDRYTRNIITFGTTVVDADDLPHTGSVSLSVVRPLGGDITDPYMNDLYAMHADFLVASSGDYFTRLKRGEY